MRVQNKESTFYKGESPSFPFTVGKLKFAYMKGDKHLLTLFIMMFNMNWINC